MMSVGRDTRQGVRIKRVMILERRADLGFTEKQPAIRTMVRNFRSHLRNVNPDIPDPPQSKVYR